MAPTGLYAPLNRSARVYPSGMLPIVSVSDYTHTHSAKSRYPKEIKLRVDFSW